MKNMYNHDSPAYDHFFFFFANAQYFIVYSLPPSRLQLTNDFIISTKNYFSLSLKRSLIREDT